MEEVNMVNRRQFVQGASALAAYAALPSMPAFAQTVDQVKVFYGFPAGSAGDVIARRIAEKFANTPYSKGQGIVDNRPGAGGRIALEALKVAPADGTHLTHTPMSCISVYPHVFTKLSYAPFVDFTPVSTSSIIHHALSVGPLVPSSVTNLKEFLAWCKANPVKANYGSPAPGSTPHFVGALLGIQSGIDMKHVAYRGSVPGITDAVGGQIACMICPQGDHLTNHRAGKLRILATSGNKRSPFVPEVPTFAEQGFADLAVEEWFGFYAPAKTPASVVNAASAAIRAAIADKSVQESLQVIGLLPGGMTPEEMARSQKAEFDKWGPLVKRIGFTAET
jgi:tripartite-type tricarboxylate transporter receptor subunit TctC